MDIVKHRAKGIDISANNHSSGEPFDFKKVKEAGYEFVYVKATQGDNYLNEYLLGDTKRAYDGGLRVGIYHFYDLENGTPEEQADWFFTNGIAQVLRENGDILGLYPILDYEVGTPNTEIRDAFILRMQEHYKHVCGQYLDRYFFSILGHAGSYTWLAWPGWTPEAGEPKEVHCVQYGQEVVPGILAMTDVNLSLNYHMMQTQFDAPPPKDLPDTAIKVSDEPITPRSNEANATPIMPVIPPTAPDIQVAKVDTNKGTDGELATVQPIERRSGVDRRQR
jgi:Glycosyl hydrolases family 25